MNNSNNDTEERQKAASTAEGRHAYPAHDTHRDDPFSTGDESHESRQAQVALETRTNGNGPVASAHRAGQDIRTQKDEKRKERENLQLALTALNTYLQQTLKELQAFIRDNMRIQQAVLSSLTNIHTTVQTSQQQAAARFQIIQADIPQDTLTQEQDDQQNIIQASSALKKTEGQYTQSIADENAAAENTIEACSLPEGYPNTSTQETASPSEECQRATQQYEKAIANTERAEKAVLTKLSILAQALTNRGYHLKELMNRPALGEAAKQALQDEIIENEKTRQRLEDETKALKQHFQNGQGITGKIVATLTNTANLMEVADKDLTERLKALNSALQGTHDYDALQNNLATSQTMRVILDDKITHITNTPDIFNRPTPASLHMCPAPGTPNMSPVTNSFNLAANNATPAASPLMASTNTADNSAITPNDPFSPPLQPGFKLG